MNKVLVYENRKIDALMWDASSPELERGAFLSLFKYLDEDWDVYSDLTEEPKEPRKPTFTLEQIAEIPAGRLKEEALAEHKNYRSKLDDMSRMKMQRKLYERSKAGDADAAKKLLNARRGYEYENWTFRNVISKEA